MCAAILGRSVSFLYCYKICLTTQKFQKLFLQAQAFPRHLIHEEEPFTLRSGAIAQGFSKGQGPEPFHRNSISESYGLILCLGHPGPRGGQLMLDAGMLSQKPLQRQPVFQAALHLLMDGYL